MAMLSKIAKKCFSSGARPCWALVIIALIELALFAEYHELRWRSVLVPSGRHQALMGEGLVIRVDGLQYYAWLRSLLIDGDTSFDNEYDEHNVMQDFLPPPTHRTPLGKRYNMSSVGPALVWSLTVVPGHYFLKLFERQGLPWPTNGYTLPYQLLIGFTTLAVCFLGVAWLYGICLQIARPARAALAVAFIVLGTTIVFYSSVGVSWGHGIGTTALALLVYYWLKSYGSMRPQRWLLVGVGVGMAATVRWSLATYAFLPAAEGLLAIWRSDGLGKNRGPWKALSCLLLAGLGAALAFLPQMIAWHSLFGAWLLVPTPQVTHHWLNPSLWALLLGTDRSLFYWTPVTLLGCVGYLIYLRPFRALSPSTAVPPSQSQREALALLFGAFLIQVYARASLLGRGPHFLPDAGFEGGVFLGEAYGCRFLTESVVPLAPGLALLLERASLRSFRILYALGCALVVWNLLLIDQYCYGLLPASAGAEPGTLLKNAFLLTRNEPLLLGQALTQVSMFVLVLGWPTERSHVDSLPQIAA